MSSTTSEGILNLAAATASLVDVDLSRKARGDALQWREEDVMFMKEQRSWHEQQVLWRKEDLAYRIEEIDQRNLINRRREIDEKNEQLKNIASISALIAGFSLVCLVEAQGNDDADSPEWLVTLYAASTSLTICLMTYAYVTCTLILVGTLKKFEINSVYEEEEYYFQMSQRRAARDQQSHLPANHQERQSFQKTRFMLFWESTCEPDWKRSLGAFSLGIPSFLFSVVMVAWIKFLPHIWPGIVVTVICIVSFLLLFWNAYMKWGVFLTARAFAVMKETIEVNPIDKTSQQDSAIGESGMS